MNAGSGGPEESGPGKEGKRAGATGKSFSHFPEHSLVFSALCKSHVFTLCARHMCVLFLISPCFETRAKRKACQLRNILVCVHARQLFFSPLTVLLILS